MIRKKIFQSWLTSSCSLWNFSFFLIASCTLSCIKKIWKDENVEWERESESELTRCIVSSKLCCGPPFIWKCLSLSCVCCVEEKEWKKWISEYVEHRTSIAEHGNFYWNSWIFHKSFFASYWRFILCKKRLLRECPVVCKAIQWDIHKHLLL